MTDLATELRRMIASMAANRRAKLEPDASHLAFIGLDPSEPGSDQTVIHWFMPARKAGMAADLARYAEAAQRSFERAVNPPLYVQQIGRAKRRTAKQHRHAIATKCKTEPGLGDVDGSVLVEYRGHRCIYDMTGDRPRFVMRNDLAKPEEPTKIVQDGMRLAAVWHVHPERRPKQPTLLDLATQPARIKSMIDLLTASNPLLEKTLHINRGPLPWRNFYTHHVWPAAVDLDPWKGTPDPAHFETPRTDRWLVQPGDTLTSIAMRHYGDVLLWPLIYGANKGVIGKDPSRIVPGQELTLPPYWKARPAPSVDELTFAERAEEAGLDAGNPDSFVKTPELTAVLGHRSMSEYLAIWTAMIEAARWKK